jgi:hypothetical protein
MISGFGADLNRMVALTESARAVICCEEMSG